MSKVAFSTLGLTRSGPGLKLSMNLLRKVGGLDLTCWRLPPGPILGSPIRTELIVLSYFRTTVAVGTSSKQRNIYLMQSPCLFGSSKICMPLVYFVNTICSRNLPLFFCCSVELFCFLFNRNSCVYSGATLNLPAHIFNGHVLLKYMYGICSHLGILGPMSRYLL